MRLSCMLFFFTAILFSCKKTEGPTGKGTIKGKIYVKDYNASFSRVLDQYYGAKEDVYIIYGDDEIYGDNMETHFDGSYQFTYLTPGTYTIYAYTEDTSAKTSNLLPVSKTVEITKDGETITVEDIIVAR